MAFFNITGNGSGFVETLDSFSVSRRKNRVLTFCENRQFSALIIVRSGPSGAFRQEYDFDRRQGPPLSSLPVVISAGNPTHTI